jgi:hypothetical protein
MTLGGAGGEGGAVCQLPPAAHGEGDGNRGASTGLKQHISSLAVLRIQSLCFLASWIRIQIF